MRTLHALLEATAIRYPEAVAIEDPERKLDISYKGLDNISDRIKHVLLQSGVKKNDRVGIYAPKSISTVAAIFGILKAEAAYVPVDPTAPASRNAFIFNDCTVKAILVEVSLYQGLVESFPQPLEVISKQPLGQTTTGIDLILVRTQVKEDPKTSSGENLSYILYTSGSTGRPKGVVHTHESALGFVDWCSDVLQPLHTDRFSSHAPFHFDLSILDIYVPIKHGGTLVLIGEELGKQPLRLANVISSGKITVWYSTPSILRMLVDYGNMGHFDYSTLRIVNFAGEVFPIKHFRKLQAAWPHPRYLNLYGPTETNVCCYYEVPGIVLENWTEPFPIGKICENDNGIIVDENDCEVGTGTQGELLISGSSVMQGYWNLPDRNKKAFYTDQTGIQWYRTGDIVKAKDNGELMFIGRRDRMVKRRGYRVELGEIESALYRHPEIMEAAVIAIPDEENGVLIKACLNIRSEKPLSIISLKQFAAANLPLYMIPDRFSFYESLPKTSTDKIDYQRLKEIA